MISSKYMTCLAKVSGVAYSTSSANATNGMNLGRWLLLNVTILVQNWIWLKLVRSSGVENIINDFCRIIYKSTTQVTAIILTMSNDFHLLYEPSWRRCQTTVNISFSQMDCICKHSQSWKACKTLTDSTSVKLPQHFYANHLPNFELGNVASKISAHTPAVGVSRLWHIAIDHHVAHWSQINLI